MDTISMLKNTNSNGSALQKKNSVHFEDDIDDNNHDSGFQEGNLMKPLADVKFEELKQGLDPSHQAGDFFKDIFPGTKILDSNTARLLYLNIPFDVDQPPLPTLILQKDMNESNQIDAYSLFSKPENQHPNLIVCKYKNFIFGGYASHPWNNKV